MELPIERQAAQALLALMLGGSLGAVYDFLKAIRLRLRRRGVTAALDVLFCVLAAFALFIMGLGPGEGQLRLFMLAACAIGGALYTFLLSQTTLEAYASFLDAFARLLRPLAFLREKVKVKLKKVGKFAKNIFQKILSWFRMNKMSKVDADNHTGEGKDGRCEAEKGKFVYQNYDTGPDSVRDNKHSVRQPKNKRRGKGQRGAASRSRADDPVER